MRAVFTKPFILLHDAVLAAVTAKQNFTHLLNPLALSSYSHKILARQVHAYPRADFKQLFWDRHFMQGRKKGGPKRDHRL